MSYKQQFNRLFGFKLNEPHSLEEIAKITKISLRKIQEVYNRGIGAYKTNPRSVRTKNFKKNPDMRKFPLSRRLTKEQWAYARVYSTIMNFYYWKKHGIMKGAFKYDNDILLTGG